MKFEVELSTRPESYVGEIENYDGIGKVGNEVKSQNDDYYTDDQALDYIALCDRKDQWEDVEHTGKGCKWKEFISRKHNRKKQGDRNKYE